MIEKLFSEILLLQLSTKQKVSIMAMDVKSS